MNKTMFDFSQAKTQTHTQKHNGLIKLTLLIPTSTFSFYYDYYYYIIIEHTNKPERAVPHNEYAENIL
jgi:hypothetical protein